MPTINPVLARNAQATKSKPFKPAFTKPIGVLWYDATSLKRVVIYPKRSARNGTTK